MEGIAGIVYPDVFQTEILIKPMLKSLAHRGGKVQDTFTYKNFQIGLTGGKLAVNAKKNVHVAVCGNPYPNDALRTELIQQGCPVQHQDAISQLILYGYELWGTEVIRRIEGDFAVLILDHSKEKLILARDRLGKMPLYWYQDKHYFIFATEMKALMATECIPQRPSLDAIASYLYFGYFPQDMAPIKGINKLLPGHFLQFTSPETVILQPYWSYWPFFEKPVTGSAETIVKHIDELLRHTVKINLPKDENVGCFLSGDLGSACMARYLVEGDAKERILSYTVGSEAHCNAAAAIAKTLQIAHEAETLSPLLLDALIPCVWHLDEPLADPSILAIWKMAEMAARHVTTVFSGMGGEELLLAQSRYDSQKQRMPWKTAMGHLTLHWIRKLLLPVFNYVSPSTALSLIKNTRTNPWQFAYLQSNALFSEKELYEVAPKIAELFDPEVFLHKFHNLRHIKSPISSFLYFDVKTRLADDLMLGMERLTSAHGLNWIPPFLDRQLVKYLAGIPEEKKMSGTETTLLLKKMLMHNYPPQVLNTLQHAKDSTVESWDLLEVFQLLPQGSLVETGLISEQWLQFHLSTPKQVQKSFKKLWALLVLEIWYRLYINRPLQEMRAPNIGVRELLLEK